MLGYQKSPGKAGPQKSLFYGKEPKWDLTAGKKRGYLSLDFRGGKRLESAWERTIVRRGSLANLMETGRGEDSKLPEVMNIRQASHYLGVAPDTLYKYLSESKIPAFKLGNRWRLKKTTLDRWMEHQSQSGKTLESESLSYQGHGQA